MRLLFFLALTLFVADASNENPPTGDECSQAFQVIDDSNPDRYDRGEGDYFASAEVIPNRRGYGEPVPGERTLDITIFLRNKKGRSKVLRGKEEYQRILQHFEGRFDQILDIWLPPATKSDLSDNLAEFNRLTGEGLSPEKAALQTWSGQRALESGFGSVAFHTLTGSPGSYTEVKVYFRPSK